MMLFGSSESAALLACSTWYTERTMAMTANPVVAMTINSRNDHMKVRAADGLTCCRVIPDFPVVAVLQVRGCAEAQTGIW